MAHQQITSRHNPLVRAAAALGSSSRERRERGLFLCEGARLCKDAVLSDISPQICFFTQRAGERYPKYLEIILNASAEAYLISQPVAELLSSTKNPQGIFCVCPWPGADEGVIGFSPDLPVLVLEGLQDPGNLGTILRTAEALGRFRVFLLGDCCDPYSPKAMRASMGAVFRLGLALEKDPERLCGMLTQKGYSCHGAVPDPQAVPVTELKLWQGRHAVFIGNEGGGLSPEVKGLCSDLITIPMRGRAESLNAAAAATVLLWELAKGEILP